jgi:PKD repeat protein
MDAHSGVTEMKSKFGILVLLLLCGVAHAAALDEAYVQTGEWGSSGSGDGQFTYILGVAVDNAGYAYVVDDPDNRVQKFVAATGQYVLKWGGTGTGPGQFWGPADVAVSATGDVYVVDYLNNRVQQFTSTGGYVRQWGTQGSADGQFLTPYGIAVDGAGNVWVADSGNYRIQKFSPEGVFLAKWGYQGSGNGQFQFPNDVAVDAAGNVWVSDKNNDRVQRFTSTGTYLAQFGSTGTGEGELDDPYGIAVDGAGNVFVVEHGNDRVQKFTPDGRVVAAWGDESYATRRFSDPWGIAVDAAGAVYVADSGNDRVQRFGRGLVALPSATHAGGEIPVTTEFYGDAEGTVTAWHWDFGDGTSSSERNPVHTYTVAGWYTVTLTVSNPGVPGTWQRTIEFEVENRVIVYRYQAENFDEGGEGVAYHDTTRGNSGGAYNLVDDVDIIALPTAGQFAVTDTREGEWTRYTVRSLKTRAFAYPLALRVKASAEGRSIEVRVNGETATTRNVRATIGYTWANTTVTLEPGDNTLTFVHHDRSGGAAGLDFDYFTRDITGGAVLIPGAAYPPTDEDQDGWFVDTNGNRRNDFADVVLYFNSMTWIAANEPLALFDYNENGRIDFADVVWLFNHL